MDHKVKYLIKNIGLLAFSNFSSKVLVFLLVPLYTNVLTTLEYGIYDLAISTVSLLAPVLTINISDAVMRFLINEKKEKEAVAGIGIKYIVGAYVFGAILLLLNWLFHGFDMFISYGWFIYAYYVTFILYGYESNLARGLDHVKELAAAGIMGTLTVLVFNILFLVIIPRGLDGYFIAIILGQLIPAVFLIWKNKVPYSRIKDRRLEWEMVGYSAPLILTTLSWWINSVSDRYVITYMCGLDNNGIYSISSKIPSIIIVVQQIFIQAWQISAFKEKDLNSKGAFHNHVLKYLSMMMVILCSILISIAQILAHVLYAKDFYIAWIYTPFLLISAILNSFSGLLGPLMSVKNKNIDIAKSSLVGAFVNMGLNIVLIFFIGVQGAAVATAVSSLLIYLMRWYVIRDIIEYNVHKKIVLSVLILCMQAALKIYVPGNSIMVLCGFLIVTVFYRELYDLMKNLREKYLGR